MNAGPYSDEKVQKFIEEEFIPLKSQCFFDRRTELMNKFDVKWTPTLLVHDSEGKEHYRIIGFVPVDDFLAHLKFAQGKIYFNDYRYDQAIAKFEAVVRQHPNGGVTPEAIYYLGVSGYLKTHDAKALRRIYDTLTSKYPESEWARRSQAYAQIEIEKSVPSSAK